MRSVSPSSFNNLYLGTMSRSKVAARLRRSFLFPLSRHFVTTGPRGLLLIRLLINAIGIIYFTETSSYHEFGLMAFLTTHFGE